MHIGNGVKAAMAIKGIRQSDIAKKLGRDRRSISRTLQRQDWPWSDIELYAELIGARPETIIAYAKEA